MMQWGSAVGMSTRDACWLGALLIVYVGVCLPQLSITADDIRVAEVFSIDEADIFAEVKRLTSAGFTAPSSYKYGGAFYYPPVLLLKAWSLVEDLSERSIILAVRAFSTATGAGCLILTCLLGRILVGRPAGLVAALLLGVNPTFLRWSVDAHPDLPQLLWITGSLLLCCFYCRHARSGWLGAAAVCAGVAFGTKYAGVFLLPVLLCAIWLAPGDGVPTPALRRFRLRKTWLDVGLVLSCFAVAFAVTNPFSVLRLPAFYRSVAGVGEIMGFGHTFRADPRGTLWLGMLMSLAGRATGFAAMIGVAALVANSIRHKRVTGDRTLMLMWVVLFLSYMMAEVVLRRSRYLLPVLPVVLVFASWSYTCVSHWFRRRFPRARWTMAVLPCLLILVSWEAAQQSAVAFSARRQREGGRVELQAGLWLSEEHAASTSIFHDAYAYIPAQFRNVFRTFGMSHTGVSHFEPDLLVVRRAIASDFADPENAARSRRGAQNYLDRHYFYDYLKEGLLPDYELAKEFGEVTVYRRITPKVRRGVHPDSVWTRLVRHYRSKRVHGLTEAHRTMGDIHASMGRIDQAEVCYERARETTNYRARLRNLAFRRLAGGHVGAAVGAFDEIGHMTEGEPSSRRAAVHGGFARRLIGADAYGPAVAQARMAARLSPELREAQFDLAAAILGSGETGQADSIYAAAVARFGPSPEAEALLRRLVGKDVAGAARLLNVHFSR